MPNQYKVSINVGDNWGYVQYDQQTQEISVVFPIEQIRSKILDYLNQAHTINTPAPGSIIDFRPGEYLAKESLHSFQTVLTRMWNNIHVHVNWSIPV